VALLASFETAYREQVTCQFMTTERESLAAMLVVRANTAREAAHVAAQEEAARMAEGAAAAAQEAARAEEIAEEATSEAAAREEMARTGRARRRTWQRRGVPARSTSSRTSAATASVWLAGRPTTRTRPTGEGSNAVDTGWGAYMYASAGQEKRRGDNE
jgi:hypothetical protein